MFRFGSGRETPKREGVPGRVIQVRDAAPTVLAATPAAQMVVTVGARRTDHGLIASHAASTVGWPAR